MPTINYIIATHAKTNPNREKTDKYSKYVLRYHLKILTLILQDNTEIQQVTIVCPDVPDDSGEYYSGNEPYINNLRSKGIIVEILPVENIGISYTQYIKCFKKFFNYDYHIIMEDDWAINTTYTNFASILVNLYKKTFLNNVGFLDCWSPLYNNSGNITFWSQFHSAITVGIISKETVLYFFGLENENNVNQLTFSSILTNSGVPIKDHHNSGFTTKILFWQTNEGVIRDYTEWNNDVIQKNTESIIYIDREPIFVPIQKYYKTIQYKNVLTELVLTKENSENIFEQ
jgi:hypothetical protein